MPCSLSFFLELSILTVSTSIEKHTNIQCLFFFYFLGTSVLILASFIFNYLFDVSLGITIHFYDFLLYYTCSPLHQCLQRFEQFKTLKWCHIPFSKYMFLRPLSYLTTRELSNAENVLEVLEMAACYFQPFSDENNSKMERNRQNHSFKSSTVLPNSL